MKQVLYLLFIVLLLFSFTSTQPNQEGNNPNQNPNQSGTNNQNPDNNPNQGGNQDQQNKADTQNQKENEPNCNENKNNPQCLKEESAKLYEEIKSGVPEFFNDMKNNSEIFSQLDSQQQNGKLNE